MTNASLSAVMRLLCVTPTDTCTHKHTYIHIPHNTYTKRKCFDNGLPETYTHQLRTHNTNKQRERQTYMNHPPSYLIVAINMYIFLPDWLHSIVLSGWSKVKWRELYSFLGSPCVNEGWYNSWIVDIFNNI